MTLAGIDLGTTHCKIGLFNMQGGRGLFAASRPSPLHKSPEGFSFYDPVELWELVQSLLAEASAWAVEHSLSPVRAIGVASMAETGLLIDPRSSALLTPLLPYFDTMAADQAASLRQTLDLQARFCLSGLRLSFKCSLAKLLWLRQRSPQLLPGAVWLSTADYIAWRLSGELATDPSLAVRTGMFRIDTMTWDWPLLASLGLDVGLPPILPSGQPLGGLRPGLAGAFLPAGTPVTVSGHDHICAALAAQALLAGPAASLSSELALDSLGTAEALVGALPVRRLGDLEWQSGFSFGPHLLPGCLYWTSGLSTAGGAIEWLRGLLADPALSYQALDGLLADSPSGPGELLFFPYLAGSGSPHQDSQVRAAFIGLSASHGRADLYRAVLEGIAFEVEYARRQASALTAAPVSKLVAAGGGVRNSRWLQIKADVSGCPVEVLPESEATALGAALLAGLGSGVYRDWAALVQQANRPPEQTCLPDETRKAAYQAAYQRYMALQPFLRSL